MSSSPHFGTGQTHLNSDAKIADEGRPQGAPLPIAFSRRYALGRAPTRGAPTNCLSRRYALGRAPTRGAPTNCLLSALCPGEGTHKGRPYQLPSLGVMGGGHPQGAPLPIALGVMPTNCLRRYALGRAPTRGAPTDCLLLGVMAWGGHPQGAPLPIVFFRRYGRGRAPTRGPYQLPSLGVMAWGGHPQGAPLPIVFSRRYALGRAPTRGAPTLFSFGVMAGGGHPQGAPLPIAFSRRYALGLAPTRGAPTNCLLSALWPGEGTHKGRPYQLSSLGVMPWGGHPQGAPLPSLGVMA